MTVESEALRPFKVMSRNTVIEQKVFASAPKADMPTAVFAALNGTVIQAIWTEALRCRK
jgi:hypothetical protein